MKPMEIMDAERIVHRLSKNYGVTIRYPIFVNNRRIKDCEGLTFFGEIIGAG